MKQADEGEEQRDTAGGGGLMPSSFVSFCEDPSRKGGFTPVYESADGSYAEFAGMASLNAGAFRLYVGGAAINRSFWPASCTVPSPSLALLVPRLPLFRPSCQHLGDFAHVLTQHLRS